MNEIKLLHMFSGNPEGLVKKYKKEIDLFPNSYSFLFPFVSNV